MPPSTLASPLARAPRAAAPLRRLARALVLLPCLLGLVGCRAFPISLFVPTETLDVLETSAFEESLDAAEIDQALAQRFGMEPELDAGSVTPAGGGLYRLDLLPETGPLAPDALNASEHPALWDLEPGDLLLAKNRKPQSLAQTLSFTEFTYYGHMGILAREEGELWVYESWPRLVLLTTADVFADRFRGGVQRVPFGEFLERYETTEIVRLEFFDGSPDFGERLAQAARDSLADDIRYDPHHDPDDPAMSCSEYVAHLIEHELASEIALREHRVTTNPSMQSLLGSLGFRTDGYVVPESFAELENAEPIAIFSHHPTRGAYLANLHAYRALHSHFESEPGGESSIASYLGIHPLRLVRYRRNVIDFFEAARAYVEAHPHASQETLRRELQAMVELFFRRREDGRREDAN